MPSRVIGGFHNEMSGVIVELDSPNCPRDTEIINEMLSLVTLGFGCPNNP
jgi:hypothetical protein